MYELREQQQQQQKDLAAVEGEIKTKLCHQLQRFAPVDTIAPDDEETVAELLPEVDCVAECYLQLTQGCVWL